MAMGLDRQISGQRYVSRLNLDLPASQVPANNLYDHKDDAKDHGYNQLALYLRQWWRQVRLELVRSMALGCTLLSLAHRPLRRILPTGSIRQEALLADR